jgi:hypothetical protein
MRRCHTLIRAALIAMTIGLLPGVGYGQASQTGARALDADHGRLAAMTGTWDVELTLWVRPNAPPLAAKGTSTIRALFDGMFIEEKIEGSMGGAPFTTLAWTGYNGSSHQYEATRIASTNPARIAESGVWDDQAKQLDLKGGYSLAGETWTQHTVIKQTSADAMIATSYLSFGQVPEFKAVEIRYTRRAP